MVSMVKRNTILWSAFWLSLLSPLYCHVLYSLQIGHSALSSKDLVIFAFEQRSYLFFVIMTSIAILFYRKTAIIFFALVVVWSSYLCLDVFVISYKKTILLYFLFYLGLSTLTLLYWLQESLRPAYNPSFSLQMLDGPSVYEVVAGLKLPGGRVIPCELTNWGKDSCFIRFLERPEVLPSDAELMLTFEGRDFSTPVEIVSKIDFEGVGLFIKNFNRPAAEYSHYYSWNDFYDIVNDRGYTPLA